MSKADTAVDTAVGAPAEAKDASLDAFQNGRKNRGEAFSDENLAAMEDRTQGRDYDIADYLPGPLLGSNNWETKKRVLQEARRALRPAAPWRVHL